MIDYDAIAEKYGGVTISDPTQPTEVENGAIDLPEEEPSVKKGGFFQTLADKSKSVADPTRPKFLKSMMDFSLDASAKAADVATGVAKSIASPFVKAAVTAGAPALATSEVIGEKVFGREGGIERADKILNEGVDVPGFGTVAPNKIGQDLDQGGGLGAETLKTVGTGLEIGTTVGGGTAAKAVPMNAGKVAAFKGGAKVGALTGGLFGTGLALEDTTPEESALETTGDVLLKGGAGAALGALAGGVGSAIMAKSLPKNDTLDLVMPQKLSKKQVLEMVKRGDVGVEEGNLLSASKAKPTKLDYEVAKSVEGVVNRKNDSIKNITEINKTIGDISENKVRPFLENEKAIYNKNILKSKFNELLDNMPESFKTDEQVKKVYEGVIRQGLNAADDPNVKNMAGLWDARKAFDQTVKREFGDKVLKNEARTVRDIAIRDTRTVMNDYIAEHTANETFREMMHKLNMMYIARDRIADKATAEFGKTGLQKMLDVVKGNRYIVSTGGALAALYLLNKIAKNPAQAAEALLP